MVCSSCAGDDSASAGFRQSHRRLFRSHPRHRPPWQSQWCETHPERYVPATRDSLLRLCLTCYISAHRGMHPVAMRMAGCVARSGSSPVGNCLSLAQGACPGRLGYPLGLCSFACSGCRVCRGRKVDVATLSHQFVHWPAYGGHSACQQHA